jgi:hypothetical protein
MENRDVRVYEVTIAAGVKEQGFHKHAVPYVFYVLDAGTANVRPEHGDATPVDYKLGDVGYGEVENHAVDNVGTSDIRVLIVDLKTPHAVKEARQARLAAAGPGGGWPEWHSALLSPSDESAVALDVPGLAVVGRR